MCQRCCTHWTLQQQVGALCVLPLCNSWYTASSQLSSAQESRDFSCNLFYGIKITKCSGWDRFFRTSPSLWKSPSLVFFLCPNGGHFWPSLGPDYSFSCSQLLVTILKLSQSVSQENYHITCMTSHTYIAQKAKLCSNVSNGSYSCITQHIQFIKTDISSAVKGNDKLQSMQAEELPGM